MTTNPSEKTDNRKSKLIGFALGFVVAFAVTYFFMNRNSGTDDSAMNVTASDLMKQEAAGVKSTKSTNALSSEGTNSQVDELGTLLILSLFTDESEKGRKEAKKDLVKRFYNDSAVMGKLVEKCATEFDKKDRNDNSIFQGIDVFLMVAEKAPESLRKHKTELYAFFEQTKGQYRERTQEKIEKIKEMVEGQ